MVRASYSIFYMGGIQELRARSTENVAGDSGEEYTNARFGVHDDEPYFGFGDIFPAQNAFKLGTYTVSAGDGKEINQWHHRNRLCGQGIGRGLGCPALELRHPKSPGPSTVVTLFYNR